MKKILFSLAVGALLALGAVGAAYADNTINVGHDKTYQVFEYDSVSLDRASRKYSLSEMEKANNALARVMGRTIPHEQPALMYNVSGDTFVKHGKKTVDVRYVYQR